MFLSHSSPACRWDRIAKCTGVGYFPSTRSVRLQLSSFPWGQALLGKTNALGISKWFLFFSSWQKQEGICLRHLLWEAVWAPGTKSHNIVGFPLLLSLPKVFNYQNCPHWASSSLSITVQDFLPQHWFPGQLLMANLCSGKSRLLFGCLSNLGSNNFPLFSPISLIQAKLLIFFFNILMHLTNKNGVATSKLLACRNGNQKSRVSF